MTLDLHGSSAVVTGASSGIGAVVAARLAARGADLVLVARRTDRLEELAARLRAEHGVAVDVVPADLTTPDGVTEVVKAARAADRPVGTLVNNAGFGTHGPFVEEDPQRVDDEVALNVTALTNLTRALLPDLLAHASGAVVNVASTAAFQPLPRMAVYGATKAYVLSFTEALSVELRGTGVHAIALCPGATRTEFFDVVGSEEPAVGRFQTADQVADTLFRALDRRRPRATVVSGRANALAAALVNVLPRRLVLAAVSRVTGG
ncbi:SDR family NAD(P)-dependent oxidoreductase [Isoptericola sediminis]|uniref:SDR family oxidoreductase n=1 Tax=Isoptericola sediminis TaxID=2733572 RepID=A0A849JVN1_9MICO|nr:SDR family oxidoreductase [Isoptericola sediminis]NNU26654.1 SDR family oxidoreductase [Isoptericola sediminis]